MARTKQRETYGNGSITPVKENGKQKRDKEGKLVWRICLTLGTESVTDAQGKRVKKRIKVQKVCHGSIADARKLCKELQQQYEHVNVAEARGKTFGEVAEAWLTSLTNEGRIFTNTLRAYRRYAGYMSGQVGDREIATLTRQDVEEALAEIKRVRRFSNSSHEKVHSVVRRIFWFAVESEWIVRNPCMGMRSPRPDEILDRRSLNREECARFRAELDRKEDEAIAELEAKEVRVAGKNATFGRTRIEGLSHLACIMALRIELATGMRKSEVLGLTWGAVNFEEGLLYVKQAVVNEMSAIERGGHNIRVKGTKTKAGRRQLYVDSDTMSHLKRWKEFQAKMLHLCMRNGEGITQADDTPVIVGAKGSWLDPHRIGTWWGTAKKKGFRDEIGFPGLRMHELRHTQATMLLGEGVDLKTVQTRMGHSQSSHTLDLYAHAIPANDRAAAAIMGALAYAQAEPNGKVVQLGGHRGDSLEPATDVRKTA